MSMKLWQCVSQVYCLAESMWYWRAINKLKEMSQVISQQKESILLKDVIVGPNFDN